MSTEQIAAASKGTVAVVGAGDYIGSAIARRLAAGGYTVVAGRRNGEKLAPLVQEIESAGGRCIGRSLDARKEEEVTAFLAEAEAIAPLAVCIFNIGANVNFPLLDTTERLIYEHINGERNRRLLIWSLLNLESWCEEFL